MRRWYLLYIPMGKVDFNLVPLPVSHSRDTVIPGRLILWIYIEALASKNTDSLTELWRLRPSSLGHLSNPLWRQAHLRPPNPSCLKNLKVPRAKKTKLAQTPTSLWYDKSQCACPNLLTIRV